MNMPNHNFEYYLALLITVIVLSFLAGRRSTRNKPKQGEYAMREELRALLMKNVMRGDDRAFNGRGRS
jgi:hypothetical protein